MSFHTIKDLHEKIDLKGKHVLLRADLNVPVSGVHVTDAARIIRLKPTIDLLKELGAKIIILSHFGRPKGEVNLDYSLEFLTPVLEKHWETSVSFAKDCIGETPEKSINTMPDSAVLLLENVRFHDGEEANDADFVKQLAALGDVFINDAFSAAHRAHASTEGLAHALPSAAGLLMEAELSALNNALETPQTPVAALVGGAKISTKLSVLHNLVKKVDYLILGGGMANTFLLAGGHEVGTSLCEKDMVEEARQINKTAAANNCEIILPLDAMVVEEFSAGAPHDMVDIAGFPSDKMALDIGEKSIAHIEEILEKCQTLLWNGPMGVFEMKPFDRGTNAVAIKAAMLTKANKLISVAGGGDTVAALENADVTEDFTYISAAGGAFLEWLEGKELPGVAALSQA